MTCCSLQELGRSIADEQDARLSRQDLSTVEGRIIEHASVTRQQPRARRSAWLVAAAAMLAAGVGAGWWQTHRPLTFEVDQPGQAASGHGIGTWVSAPETGSVPVRFSDGTRVVLEAGARARITQIDHRGVGIVVETGRLGFNVVHRDSTRWSIATGPFAVTVTGTEFDLGWQPETETLQIAVRQGSVLVTGCQFSGGKPVGANEVLRTRCGDTLSVTTTQRAEASSEPALPSAQASVEADSATPDRPNRTSESAASPAPTWQTIARAGHYRAAFELASRAGFETECARVSASDLALLMDVARYAGHVDRSEQAARALRARFAGKPQAALAAFTLGRIAFDRASDYGEAARWFRVYLGEQPGGGLAREAEGRLMESLARSGQMSQARQIAREYLDRYPDGPHARLARQLIGS